MEGGDPREVQSLQMYLNEYGQQMEMLSQQLGLIEQRRVESLAAVEALESLDGQEDGIALLPIGGGVSVRARILDPDRLLVNIGAEIIVSKTNEEAISFLKEHVTEMEALEKKVAESMGRVRAQIDEINRRLETLYRTASREQAGT